MSTQNSTTAFSFGERRGRNGKVSIMLPRRKLHICTNRDTSMQYDEFEALVRPECAFSPIDGRFLKKEEVERLIQEVGSEGMS